MLEGVKRLRDTLAARLPPWVPTWLLDLAAATSAIWLIVAANLLFMRPHAAMLQHWDEAYALAFARRMLEGSNLPYVDGVSHRGPLFYWIVALAVKIYGYGSWMPTRALTLVSMLLTVGVGFAAASTARHSLAGAIMSLVLFCMCLTSTGEGAAGFVLAFNSEHLANVFGMVALLGMTLAVRRPERAPSLIGVAICGLAIMVSGLCKQVGLTAVLPFGAWVAAVAFEREGLSKQQRWTVVGVFAAGLAAPLLVVLLRYAAAGELGTFIYYFFTYNTQIYVAAIKGTARAHYQHDIVLWRFDLLAMWTGLAGWGASRVFATTRSFRGVLRPFLAHGFEITVAASTVLSLLAANSSLRAFGHYYVQVIPWTALLGGLAIERVVGTTGLAMRRFPLRSFLVRAAVLLPLVLVANVGWQLRQDEFATDSEFADSFVSQDRAICRFVERYTKPTESIFVWGFDPVAYTSCNRRAATRFVFTTFVAGVVPWVADKRSVEEARVVPGSRELMLADLRKDMPAAIFDSAGSMMNRSMMDYPFLRRFIESNYCPTPAYGLSAWLRRPVAGCAAVRLDPDTPVAETRPLATYWSERSAARAYDIEARALHRDSVTLTSGAAPVDSPPPGYTLHDTPGWDTPGALFTTALPGTAPLKLFHNERTDDWFSTATVDGEASAHAEGYRFERVEGYVFVANAPGTLPLLLLYNPQSRDNLTTASADERVAAYSSGYVFVRIEGYVPRS